jgi:diketogulonate reductase-like aldo/keto reductase
MQTLLENGDVRAIGVSNFMKRDLDLLYEVADTPPAVDQVEFHPYLQRPGLQEYCRQRGITMEAWSPLMRGRGTDLPLLDDIGQQHGKSSAQVTLRWILQKGVVTIPKAVQKQHIAQNADIFDFELSDEEMASIDALDRGRHGD